ncbi:hypothetical protein DFA_07244 [Cavenderia fasciculata]|uniref:Uncharacterized protein n=1 Tax=Cavenderia fasciculata TaxID=261658 RepID=F4PVW0_CACFS|nr:uncharacterized protein DFA_07244 [Cavenderia fasciculata]EGG20124.1 hypothetical protein DFA_07244 [Cavenderia fasciculata]|eukprot:XP_004367107.1 hypothetical protein DFA_07244 [Cavenderia fasciculata]
MQQQHHPHRHEGYYRGLEMYVPCPYPKVLENCISLFCPCYSNPSTNPSSLHISRCEGKLDSRSVFAILSGCRTTVYDISPSSSFASRLDRLTDYGFDSSSRFAGLHQAIQFQERLKLGSITSFIDYGFFGYLCSTLTIHLMSLGVINTDLTFN